jgi:hypothetical protein
MRKNCVFVLLGLSMALFAALALRSSEAFQAPAAAELPAQILQGSENFNLAIDAFGDSRGNLGPCG